MGKSNNSTVAIFILAIFVLLVAGRDIAYELFLNKSPAGISFAFWVCATASVLSCGWLVIRGELRSLFNRVFQKRIFLASVVLGFMCAVIYVTTFIAIEYIGAGMFNMLDWGLAPVLTALIGIWYDKDIISRPRILFSLTLYIIGTIGLYSASGEMQSFGPIILLFALLSPVFTAISFPLQRWLMENNEGPLTEAQVTFVRFLPATVVIFLYEYFVNGSFPEVVAPFKLFSVTIILGFIPLILLCYALVKSSLSRFAVWLFGIPALAFFGTLHIYPNHQKIVPIISSFIILTAILIMEWPTKKK